MKRTMLGKRVVTVLSVTSAALFTALLAITPSHARTTDFGVRGGVYPDEDKAFLGAEALFGVSDSKRWFGNPNVEQVLVSSGDLTTFSFDFHYDFPSGAPYSVWLGAGPTLIHQDKERAGSGNTNDTGVNLLVGVGARKGEVRPYGQFKVVVADDNQAVVGMGVRF